MALADQQDGTGASLGWLKALTLLIAAVVVTHGVTFGLSGLPGDSGRVGSEAFNAVYATQGKAPTGFLRIGEVSPDGQLASAGVRPGDAIRFEHPRDVYRLRLPENQRFNLTVLRDGQSIPTSFVTTASRRRGWSGSSIISALASLFMAGAGLTIALRARGRVVLLLGATLVSMANLGSFLSGWENDIARYVPVELILGLIMTLAPIGIFGFALLQRAEATRQPPSRLWRAVFGLYVLALAADNMNAIYANLFVTTQPLTLPPFGLLVLYWSGYIIALGLLTRAAFETAGQERTRFGFLTVALGLYFAGTMMVGMIINMTGNDFSLANPLSVLGHALTLSAIVVFLYAALKHRVVDLGFAVNRTLVFGVLSTTLLFTFFFLEWGAEQVIPVGMREASLLVSAGIAFVLFLVFHKAKEWVEKGVEHLFFRRWRDNEAELKRFVRQSAFVTRPDALRLSAIAALSRFAGGAEVALYGAAPDGQRVEAGRLSGLPELLDADLELLVRLRAERQPLEDGMAHGTALALPILHRNELTGVFILGPKPGGELYRPDEIEVLSEAATRIGMDLHALRMEALEVESREQRRRADLLERQMQRAIKAGARA